MSAVRTPFMLLVLAVGVWCFSADSRAQDAQAQQSQLAAEPTDPPRLTLAQMPPSPPVALYQNGQVTIEALNATLSDVLRAACKQTGTALDLPPGADERVVGTYGPGPPREVIASLLNGSGFNYVMLGSVHDANRLVQLTLSPKPAAPPENRSVRPATQLISKAAEVIPLPQLPQQQAKPSAEPSAADSQTPPRLPRRTRHRGR
jgi:hypothetical protein